MTLKYEISAKKQKLIEEWQNSPIVVGDVLCVNKKHIDGRGGQSKSIDEIVEIIVDNVSDLPFLVAKIKKISAKNVIFEKFIVNLNIVPYKKADYHIGANPIDNNLPRIDFMRKDLESVLFETGLIGERSKYNIDGFVIPEINFNPYIMRNDKKIYYQRGYVWKLEDKQNLIQTIYNNITIGSIILRSHSWKYVEKQIKSGNTEVAFKDVVDGKQRLSTIAAFVNNEFPDKHGNFYGDLSFYAQMSFMNRMVISYGVLSEDTTDEQVLTTFKMINTAGVALTKEHLELINEL